MNCPSCNSPLEPNARFCGVCGYRLVVAAAGAAAQPAAPPRNATVARESTPAPIRLGAKPAVAAIPAAAVGTPKPARIPKSRKSADEVYINQVLNGRFKVESKIGEGGFGAVYRGVQLATGRKVALKLLHPEMTKDENLVARFEREGRVLCNLRDAHTITTYDFDRTTDGTLYIAMELLEGKSLHQLFHDEAPLEWKRVFKILIEMCSSLAEAHAQGIVHRDLKPENVYLEPRSGNPEFVKILDFGIAKVMRGDTIDPQAPQLTATGQTLGTLEYMSPEQLMGKQLDGRSDVYALGVVAYEMITGRLPFPDAKGPAGLITAQLKQTPVALSQANPKVAIPGPAERVIFKCLAKDKTNRYPDVSQLATAMQEVLQSISDLNVLRAQSSPAIHPELMAHAIQPAAMNQQLPSQPGSNPNTPPQAYPLAPHAMQGSEPHVMPAGYLHQTPAPYLGAPSYPPALQHQPVPQYTPQPQPQEHTAQVQPLASHRPVARSKLWVVWWVLGLLALGAGVGAVIAVLSS